MSPAANRADTIERLAELDGRRLKARRQQQEAGQRLEGARTKLERAAADAEHRVHRTHYRQITTEMRELCAELGYPSIMQARQAGVLEPRRSSVAKAPAVAVTTPRRTGRRPTPDAPQRPQSVVDNSEEPHPPQGTGALIESRPPETPSSPRSRWLARIGVSQPRRSIVVDLTTETTTNDDTGTTTCTIVTSAKSGASGDLMWLATFGASYIERWLVKPSAATTLLTEPAQPDKLLHTVENGDGVWQAETYSEKQRGVAYVSFELRDHHLVWLEYGKAGADRATQATRNLGPIGGRRRSPENMEAPHGESVTRSS